MPATCEERAKPFRGPTLSRDIEYLVRGVDNYNEAYQAVADFAPLVYPDTSLLRGTIRLDQQGDRIWYATANYTPIGPAFAATVPPVPPPEVGTVVRTVNYHAKPKKLWNFLEPLMVRDSSGDVTNHYPRLKWKIDSQLDPGKGYRSQGTDFEPLPELDTYTYYAPNVDINDTYLDAVGDLVSNGCFNSTTYGGRAPGSLQIVRFSANQRSVDDWELSFGFGYKPLEEDFKINSSIILPLLRGCDYYWSDRRDEWNETENIVEAVDYLVVLGRVWHLADFNVLDLP
jgi:hypothetical protein